MIAITMGDPNGVGPEIVVRGFAAGIFPKDTVVYGDAAALRVVAEALKTENLPGGIELVDCRLLSRQQISPGTLSEAAGAAAIEYVRRATEDALRGEIDAIVTLPVNKEAVGLSIPGFQGHTDFIADLCGVSEYAMMLASERLAVAHLSTHLSLREAIERVTTRRVVTVAGLLDDALRRFLDSPRLAVAGLNPHAGENGAFGSEDDEEIRPAVERLRSSGMKIEGPIPADTLFYRGFSGDYDGVVCMYHDQGHIPMKTIDFAGTVNVTLGLPIVRTSVDHGTAFDIAYQGRVNIDNAAAAYRYAERLLQDRR